MRDEFRILFVSRGNICRSPVAERLLRAKLDRLMGPAARMITVESAGISAQPGAPMDPSAEAEVRRLGGDPSDFRARRLTWGMAEGADLLLTATKELRSRTLEEAPRALRRTFTILEFTAAVLAGTSAKRDPVETALTDCVHRASARRPLSQATDLDVPDPIGGPEALHRQVADLLDLETSLIAAALATTLDYPAWERVLTRA